MFYEGTLQTGIGLAIQERKLVACFVRDDGEESATWENEWLQSGWNAILLRLDAGSTEAGFLSAFCPIAAAPTFVVINNGQLLEQLVSGSVASKDEFVNRVRAVLGAPPIPGASQLPRAPVSDDDAAAGEPADSDRPPVSPILPPSSKARGKQKAIPPDPKPHVPSPKAAQQSARDALRKKKQEEKEELARIQARIEADKAERKAQVEARRLERERLVEEAPVQSAPRTITPSTKGSQSKDVHLNVRLFDGRTIRSVFPRTAKLQNDVRPWIDEQFAARAEHPNENHPPYFFKQIQAPLPSRELTTGDESQMLGDIGLAPSATLVLIPIKGYTEAYSDSRGGLVSGVTGLIGGAFGLAHSAVGYVGSTLGSVIGVGGSGADEQEQRPAGRTLSEETAEATGGSGIRVRTLADQRANEPRSQQLYNGNQLNFEPNDDEAHQR